MSHYSYTYLISSDNSTVIIAVLFSFVRLHVSWCQCLIPITVIIKAIKMANKSRVSLGQHSTVQFEAKSHLQRVAHPATPTLCQHPANW